MPSSEFQPTKENIKQNEDTQSTSVLHDLLKSFLMRTVLPVHNKPGLLTFIGIAVAYAVTITVLFACASPTSQLDSYLWPLLSFFSLLVYFYLGGLILKLMFKKKPYSSYVYICAVSSIHTPIFIFAWYIFAKHRYSFSADLVELSHNIVNFYLVYYNAKDYSEESESSILLNIVLFFLLAFLIKGAYVPLKFIQC